MKNNFFYHLFFLLPFWVSCHSDNKQASSKAVNGKPIKTASLRFDWITNMSYIGEVIGMTEFSKKYDLNLVLEQAPEGIDPIKMVIAGANSFGIVSADKLIMANEKGANLVAVGIVNNVSPAVFIAKSEKNIKIPKDFEGKKMGVAPGGSTEYVYRALMKKNNIDLKKIKEVPASYDMSTFLTDKHDITPAYIYVEPVLFDKKGIQYTIIEPQKFGLNFPGRVYFTTATMVKEHPEVVQAFINTMADGWIEATKNKEKSIQMLKNFDKSIDENNELLSYEKGISYFMGFNKQVLTIDINAWNDMIADLKSLNIIKNGDFSQALDLSFIKQYHSQNQ